MEAAEVIRILKSIFAKARDRLSTIEKKQINAIENYQKKENARKIKAIKKDLE